MAEVFEELFGLAVGIVLGILLTTLPVMWLWNWLMPELFGFVTITFWQALGMSTLCSLLFRAIIPVLKKSN